MAKDRQVLVTQSVLDRLMDIQIQERGDWPRTTRESVEKFKRAVKRDLEWLLNTRQTLGPLLNNYPATQKSVFNYGLPDMTMVSMGSVDDRKRLTSYLETTVMLFEPRIENLQISIELEDNSRRQIKFRFAGTLRMDPQPEEVSFDTLLELTSGEYQVK